MDLNVKVRGSEKENYAIFKRCVEFGWEGLVWTQSILAKSGRSANIQPKKPLQLTVSDMAAVAPLRALAVDPEAPFSFSQYNRVNVIVDDVGDAQILSEGSEQFKKFDILSATPGNSQAFAYLCKSADVDIITIDYSHKVSFSITKKMVDEAIKRGVHFEIQYSPALVPGTRSELLSSTRNLVKFLRGKAIAISSGTDNAGLIRGPFDAMNIAMMMKFSREQARSSVTIIPQRILDHATARRNKYIPITLLSRASYEEDCSRLAKELVQKKGALSKPAKKRCVGRKGGSSAYSSDEESDEQGEEAVEGEEEEEDDGEEEVKAVEGGAARRKRANGKRKAGEMTNLPVRNDQAGSVDDDNEDDGFLRL